MAAPIWPAAIALLAVSVMNGLHQVQEGHVGVYWRGGALLSTVTEPGFHWKLPFITTFAEVQITVQTDRVTEIPCGTSGGVMITFESIEVVNRLSKGHVLETVRKYGIDYDAIWIFDKIHHEINQFCSSHSLQEVYIEQFDKLDESLALSLQTDCDKWDTGIEVIATRVTKPRIPPNIQKNFEQMEAEKTKLLITSVHQRVIEKEQETDKLLALIQAQKRAQVSRINMEREVEEKLTFQQMQGIADAIYLAKQKALADAAFYKQQQLAGANRVKYSDAYVFHEVLRAVREQRKVFYGASLRDWLTGASFNATTIRQLTGALSSLQQRQSREPMSLGDNIGPAGCAGGVCGVGYAAPSAAGA